MYAIIYLTEACNLECRYCESRESRGKRQREVAYSVEDLVAFLRSAPEVSLQFYGGEPLLRIDLLERIVDQVQPGRICIQTNGLLLDQVPARLLERIDVLCVSLDGPPELTNASRGAGVYERAVANVRRLRERGFRGRADARMTTTPGVPIFEAVTHFTDHPEGLFEGVYWQLNVMFGVADWRFDRKFITRWLTGRYAAEITALVDHWVAALREGRLLGIIPFAGLTYSLLTGHRVECVRCGAGHDAWTIVPSGEVFPCPVLRESPAYSVGHITEVEAATLRPMPGLRGPCAGCDLLDLCGGRCIYASESLRWGPEGFEVVCSTVRHLIRSLERVAPEVGARLSDAGIGVEALWDLGFDYEVIP